MSSCFASRAFATILLVLAALALSTASLCAAASSQSYELQRRLGSDGAWTTLASFSISRHSDHSAPRLRFTPPADKDLTKEEKKALTQADLIYYRATTEGTLVEDAVMVSITPCSIIRGFNAVDSTTVVLREKLRVLPGPGTSLVGLQVSSETNFFHSKMNRGDECDLSVVEKLFPTVRVKAELSLLPSVELASKVNYADLRLFFNEDGNAQAKGGKGGKVAKKKMQVRRVKNAEGEWVEEEVEVDDRGFLQKYWMYLVIPIVMSLVQNMGK